MKIQRPGQRTIKNLTQTAEGSWRPEIQGLRALALLLVAGYHFWLGRVSGGVDVFLFISAFLLTSSMAQKVKTGRLSGPGTFFGLKTLVAYWARVVNRLVPLAAVTVLLTLLGSYYLIPAERWLSLLDEALAVVGYQHHTWSIEQAVDYYAADSSKASPLRHFWSLSLQWQIYLLWPLIFWAVSLLLTYKLAWSRLLLTLVFGLIFLTSLAYSIEETALNQATAYFDLKARYWEFAAGSLLALWAPSIRLGRRLRIVLGWLGLLALLLCGVILDVNGTFPGFVALWPLTAAALLILAGQTQSKWGADRLLTARPLLALGRYSYALYLVHWPLLVFYLNQSREEKASFWAGCLLLLLSLLLAWALTNLLDRPVSSWPLFTSSALPGLALSAFCLWLATYPIQQWERAIYQQVAEAEVHREENNVGAAVLEPSYQYQGQEEAPVIPLRPVLETDWADLGPACLEADPSLNLPEDLAPNCSLLTNPDQPEATIVAWGNSHIQMWATALEPLAQERNWKVIMLTRGGCFLGPEDNAAHATGPDCDLWAEQSAQWIEALGPDTVLLHGTRSEENAPDLLLESALGRVDWLLGQGISVLAMRDTPRLGVTHKECMDSLILDPACSLQPGQDVYSNPLDYLLESRPGLGVLNYSDLVCPDNLCPPEIGNIYTYFDHDHITATYLQTVGPYFVPRFLQAYGQAESWSLPDQQALAP